MVHLKETSAMDKWSFFGKNIFCLLYVQLSLQLDVPMMSPNHFQYLGFRSHP